MFLHVVCRGSALCVCFLVCFCPPIGGGSAAWFPWVCELFPFEGFIILKVRAESVLVFLFRAFPRLVALDEWFLGLWSRQRLSFSRLHFVLEYMATDLLNFRSASDPCEGRGEMAMAGPPCCAPLFILSREFGEGRWCFLYFCPVRKGLLVAALTGGTS